MPKKIDLLVLDFDGVITDNRVWVDETGREMVVACRSDSLIMETLKKSGVQVLILSSEVNLVVEARAKKMDLEVFHGVNIHEKGVLLKQLITKRKIDPANVVYVGNDINDLPCFKEVGWSVAVADAQPEVIRAADWVLCKAGGQGAVRELCDLILVEQEARK